jgi:hypothetical protein
MATPIIEGPCHLYYIIHRETGRGYAGISIQYKERWIRHKWEAFSNNCQTHFARALRKYGAEAFDWTLVHEFDTVEHAKNAEIFTIACGHGHLNDTEGGDGVNGMSEESKARKSAALRGQKRSPETIAKMSAAQTGREVSDEARENMRKSRLEYLAENGPYESTPERNEKISKAKLGQKCSDEHREAMSKARSGVSLTEEHKQNISIGKRKYYEENPEAKEHLSNLASNRRHTEESKQKMRDSWIIRKQKKLEKQNKLDAKGIPEDLSKDK